MVKLCRKLKWLVFFWDTVYIAFSRWMSFFSGKVRSWCRFLRLCCARTCQSVRFWWQLATVHQVYMVPTVPKFPKQSFICGIN